MRLLTILCVSITLLMFCGCQEQQAKSEKQSKPVGCAKIADQGNAQSRLIADENLRLKNRIAELEKIIAAKDAEIEKINSENQKELEASAESSKHLLDMFAEAQGKIEQLEKELAELKQK